MAKIRIKLEISSRLARSRGVGRASGKQPEQQWSAQKRGVHTFVEIGKLVARRIIQRIVNVMNRRREDNYRER